MFEVEREIGFNGVIYKIVDVLNSSTLLVVRKDDYDKGVFPLQTYVIPGE